MNSLNALKIPSLLLIAMCATNLSLAQEGFLPGLLRRTKRPQSETPAPQAPSKDKELLIDLDSQEMESFLSNEGDVESALDAYKKLRLSERNDEKQIIEALHGIISIWEVSDEDFQIGVQPYANLLTDIIANTNEIEKDHSYNLIWAAYECVYPVAHSDWSSYLTLRAALSEVLRLPGLEIAQHLQTVKKQMTPLSDDTLAFQNTIILNHAKNFQLNELGEITTPSSATPPDPSKNAIRAQPIGLPVERPGSDAAVQLMPSVQAETAMEQTPSKVAGSPLPQGVPDTAKIRELKEKLEQSRRDSKAQGKLPNVNDLIAYSAAVKEELEAREAAQRSLQNAQGQAETEIQQKRSHEAAELREMKQSDAEAALEARKAELEAQRIELERRLEEINNSLGR